VDDIALTLVSVPNPVPGAGHFNRALLGTFSRAPRQLYQNPQGLYRIEVDAPSYLAVSQFVNIGSAGPTTLPLTLPVNKDRVVSVTFPNYAALAEDARRVLEASPNVLGYQNTSGNALYEAFDDIRRAGLLNLITKAAHTRLVNDRPVLSYIDRITEQRGDRLFARVAPDFHSEVQHSVNDELFHPVEDTLHVPPLGFRAVDSYKTWDHYGNLQLTFASDGTNWSLDMDIDDAQGLEHIFQVVHNTATGQPTHPYNIHEILVEYQELDPGYRFDLGTTATARTTAAGKS
jgi:hypothetical protein